MGSNPNRDAGGNYLVLLEKVTSLLAPQWVDYLSCLLKTQFRKTIPTRTMKIRGKSTKHILLEETKVLITAITNNN